MLAMVSYRIYLLEFKSNPYSKDVLYDDVDALYGYFGYTLGMNNMEILDIAGTSDLIGLLELGQENYIEEERL